MRKVKCGMVPNGQSAERYCGTVGNYAKRGKLPFRRSDARGAGCLSIGVMLTVLRNCILDVHIM